MRERPIIMGADSVRAILDGRKTQTRRVIKPQPIHMPEGAYIDPYNHNYEHFTAWTLDNKMLLNCGGNIKNTAHWKCPYGVIGDRLWVREIFNCNEEGIAYKATQPDMDGMPWKSPIYMPRTYSRITLEITDIRVERLQDITNNDAKSEGVEPEVLSGHYYYLSGYHDLWQDLNAKRGYPWESNPWVWVISFKQIHDQKEDV